MVSSLLTTKFFIPQPTANLVPRARLIERLNVGLGSKLVLVSAPAGFGKSTLISEWVSNIRKSVTWLTLDKNDNRLRRFLSYLIAALQQIDDSLGADVLPALEATDSPPVELILSTLINQIALSNHDFLIVLDDYHQISSQAIHDCIDFYLENLPPNFHFVICSRVDPPLALSRLRARGQLLEIRSQDLRFTQPEVAVLLNDMIGLGLTLDAIATLSTRTEGWITGLQLAALSLRDREDKQEFVEAFSGSHHYIIDYLVDEVMSRQPDNIRSFLRRTSILDRFNAPLCDAVLASSNSKQILHELVGANFFLIPLDDQRIWYRYHQLFEDFLSVELLEMDPEIIPELHRRAAHWLELSQSFDEAINHALAGKDYQHAAKMIGSLGPEMIIQNEYGQLATWLDQMPQELVETQPWLCIIRAWIYDRWAQFDVGEYYLNTAEDVLDSEKSSISGEEADLIRGQISTIRAIYALKRGEIKKSIEHSNQALYLLPENYFMRCGALLTLGWAQRAYGDLPGAIRTQIEGHQASLSVGNHLLAQVTKLEIGKIQFFQGHLHQAAETLREAAQHKYQNSGLLVPYASSASIGLAMILAEWNDLEAALDHIQEGIEIGISSKLYNSVATGYAVMSSVYLAQSDLERASQDISKAETMLIEIPDLGLEPRSWIINSRVRLLLAQNKFAEALKYVQQNELNAVDEGSYLTEFREINKARTLIYLGRKAAAQELVEAHTILEEVLELANPAGFVTTEIEALVLQALAFHAQGESGRAMASLEQALLLAHPEGFVRTFINEGEPMRELLEGAADNQVLEEYIAELLSAYDDRTYSQRAVSLQPLVDPISEREHDVLKLLATELSGPEIAQELMISLNTMRTHTKNIYAKLGVNNRRSAVRRAKELNLL